MVKLHKSFRRAIVPQQGDWSLMQWHIENIICNGNAERATWVTAWFAHILQHPGRKNRTTIVLKGGQGTGKNIFIDNIGACLGKHFKAVTQSSHVTGKFNSHMKDCILLFANEAVWGGAKQDGGVLKSLITDNTIQIEPKGVDTYAVRNHMNVVLASNNDWIVPAELDERRFYVIEVSESMKQNKEYFKPLVEQMNNGGREAMLYDLLRMELSGINLDAIERNGALFKQQLHNMDSKAEYWYHRLDDGYLLPIKTATDGQVIRNAYPEDGWTGKDYFLVSQTQYEDYLDYCASRSLKYTASPTSFGMFFTQFQFKTERPKKEGRKTKGRLFPSLEECRRLFANMMKMQVNELFID